MNVVTELYVDQGPYEDEVNHYLRLVNYALGDPPDPGIEEDMIKAFLVRELKYIHEELGELGYGSPADNNHRDGIFGLAVCLGSEAILEHYRRHKNVASAARFAADCLNWRPCEQRAIRKHKEVFRKARKEAPAEFWELNWISLELFDAHAAENAFGRTCARRRPLTDQAPARQSNLFRNVVSFQLSV
jgi:predicted HD phosphohydrolase